MLKCLALVAALLSSALCDPMWQGPGPESGYSHPPGGSLRLFGKNLEVGEPQQSNQQGHVAAPGSSSIRLFGADLDPFANLSMHSHSGGQESFQHDHSMAHETDTNPGTDMDANVEYNQDEDMGYYDYQDGQFHHHLGYEDYEQFDDQDQGDEDVEEELEDGEIPPDTHTSSANSDIDSLIQSAPLKEILDMKLPLSEHQIRLLMEMHFPTLSFYVIDPTTHNTEHVSVAKGHGILHVIGHGDNYLLFQEDIAARWPSRVQLDAEKSYEKAQAEKALKRSQQAMKYLSNNPRAGVYHEPSQRIFMSPLASKDDTELIAELVDKYWKSDLPTLKHGDMLHYKTSYTTKLRHRQSSLGAREKGKQKMVGKTIDDETSSQGSNTEMEMDHEPLNTFEAIEQQIPRKARSRKTRPLDQL